VNSGGGNDHIDAGAAGSLAHLALDAGGGLTNDDDKVVGSDFADVIISSSGADTLEGRGGDDKIFAGAGDDSLAGGAGHDELTGGEGTDTFECDELGEALDIAAGETFTGFCRPPAPPSGGGGGGETGPTTPTTPTTPATDALGFAKPSVKATRTGLRVTLKSTGAAPVSVSLKAAERFKSPRAARYRVTKRTIAAGGSVTLALRAPRALRERIARQLTLHHPIVRRPTIAVTNTATTARASVHPRLTLRVR
jgi:hypothetical protein